MARCWWYKGSVGRGANYTSVKEAFHRFYQVIRLYPDCEASVTVKGRRVSYKDGRVVG